MIDFAAIFKIVVIDIMLGVDNAILIALACSALPAHQRAKAIFWGTGGAIILRAILLVFATYLLAIPYLKIVAGAFLLYIGYKLLVNHDQETNVESADGIIAAIKTIIVADFMMSLDNVMAVAGAASSAGQHSTLYAIGGIILSIPIIVLGSKYFITLMEKYTWIIWVGAGLLGWVGAEMIVSDPMIAAVVHGQTFSAEFAYKIAGFCAVIFSVVAVNHFKKA